MKTLICALSVFVVTFGHTACLKDKNNSCQNKTVQSEEGTITAFAAGNGISGTTHSSGVYYQNTVTGGGPAPTATSKVSVRYIGKLLNGTVFDSQTGAPVTFTVGGTIPGFSIGLQQMHKGGTIKILVPSSLAYGCSGAGSIPPDSILYFEIELIDVF